MICLIDRGFRINNALTILVNQCKYPGIYNECFCLCCKKDNDNVNDNDNANDNVDDNDNDNDNDNVNDNDNLNDNNNVNDNDNVNDNFIYLFDEKHQRGKPNNKEYPRTDSVCGKPIGFTDLSNNISVNTNEDLQSWLNDDIITAAALPENFRCIISGPSECSKTFF